MKTKYIALDISKVKNKATWLELNGITIGYTTEKKLVLHKGWIRQAGIALKTIEDK